MVEINTGLDEKSLKEYCRFNFRRSKRNIILIAVLAVVYFTVLIGCFVLFFAFGYIRGMILAAVLSIFWGAGAMFLRSVLNTFARKAMEDNRDNTHESVILGESSILVCKNGEPIGEIKWEKITEIFFNDKAEAVYLSAAKEEAVLILEKKNIISGTMEELKRITEGKRREITK